MSKIRKIKRKEHNFYIVDACFLANKFIKSRFAPNLHEKTRIEYCLKWWNEIDKQIKERLACVYIPDICIAESFKVLAKKYYCDNWFKTPGDLKLARKRLENEIRTSPKILKAKTRHIKYHDIPTCRDIIISVDRFYELFFKNQLNVSLPDLILVATCKYLMDFYHIPFDKIHIVTLDKDLRKGSIKISEIPNAYDPTHINNYAEKIFE